MNLFFFGLIQRNGRQMDVGVFVENGLQEHPVVPRARERIEAHDRVLYVDDDFPAIPEIQSSPSIRMGAGNISISSPFLNGQDLIPFPNRFFPVQSSPSNGKGTGKSSSSASTIREAVCNAVNTVLTYQYFRLRKFLV